MEKRAFPNVRIVQDTETATEQDKQRYEAFSKTLFEQAYKFTSSQISKYFHQKVANHSSLNPEQVAEIDAKYPEPRFLYEDPEVTDAIAGIFARKNLPVEAAGGVAGRMLSEKDHTFQQNFLTAIRERAAHVQNLLNSSAQSPELARDGLVFAEIERHVDFNDEEEELPFIDETMMHEVTPGAQAIHNDLTVVSETLGALDPDKIAEHIFFEEMKRSGDPNEAMKNLEQAQATSDTDGHKEALEYAKNLARSRELIEQYFPFVDSHGHIDGTVITKLKTYFDQLSSKKVNSYPTSYLAPIFANYVRSIRTEAAQTLEQEMRSREMLEEQTSHERLAEITVETQIGLHTDEIDKINPLISQADQFLEELEAITDDTVAPSK